MKLTKSQRLFIKAGEAVADERLYKWYNESDEDYSKEIAKAKRKRKKLLREALEAAILEREGIYGEGLADAFKSHLE